MSAEFRKLLVDACPESSWATLTRGAGEGIEIADKVRRSTPFLATLVGNDQRGMLRRAAIMWRIHMLCKSKELPFEAAEIVNPYTNGTSHLISVRSGKLELHIVRTDEPEAFPLEALLRKDNRTSNQADFFRDGKLLPIHVAIESMPQIYGWIMWGATKTGELTHFAIGLPEPDRDMWLTYIDVLAHVRATEAKVPGPIEKSSKPNPAMLLKFREEIARSIGQDNLDQDIAGNGA
jgi:hypothetical protein